MPVPPINNKCDGQLAVAYNDTTRYAVIAHIMIGDAAQYPYHIKSRWIKPCGYVMLRSNTGTHAGTGSFRLRAETRSFEGSIEFLSDVLTFDVTSRKWKALAEIPKVGDVWTEIPLEAYELWWEAKSSVPGVKTRLEAGGVLLRHVYEEPKTK